MKSYMGKNGTRSHQTSSKKDLVAFSVSEAKQGEGIRDDFEGGCSADKIFVNTEESLMKKKKWSRISNHEKAFLYLLMKQNKKSKIWMAMDYNVSLGTLNSIEKELQSPIRELRLRKSSTSRNMIESPKFREIIQGYLIANKTPWTAKDLWSFLLSKTGIIISERVVREILTRILKMKYKKGLSRLVTFDESRSILAKQLFSIKLCRLLDQFSLLINVDESSFSWMTTKNFSWIPKGKEQIIKNICFQNSWTLITAITSTGGVFAAKSNESVNSNLFVNFMRELATFIRKSEKQNKNNCLIILDNCSVHRSQITTKYMQSENINIAFIPQYCLEMAPIEHYFSKLKQIVIKTVKWKSINLMSAESNLLLKEWLEGIPSRMVRKIWWSFASELTKSIDLLQHNRQII